MSDIHFDVPFTRHKHVELEAHAGNSDNDVSIRFTFTTKGDHPGVRFYVTLGKLFFGGTFYDDRHWDWNKDTYCDHADKEEDDR